MQLNHIEKSIGTINNKSQKRVSKFRLHLNSETSKIRITFLFIN